MDLEFEPRPLCFQTTAGNYSCSNSHYSLRSADRESVCIKSEKQFYSLPTVRSSDVSADKKSCMTFTKTCPASSKHYQNTQVESQTPPNSWEALVLLGIVLSFRQGLTTSSRLASAFLPPPFQVQRLEFGVTKPCC